MKVLVTQAFKFAIGGTEVVEFDKGERDLPKRAAEIALKEGWAQKIVAKPAHRRKQAVKESIWGQFKRR